MFEAFFFLALHLKPCATLAFPSPLIPSLIFLCQNPSNGKHIDPWLLLVLLITEGTVSLSGPYLMQGCVEE